MYKIQFSKYQGLGNDFILFEEKDISSLDYPALAKAVCDRHFGIGADGMALIRKTESGWAMPFYNADGSEAPMCGNASRCVADYLSKNYKQRDSFNLITKGAVLKMEFVNSEISANLGKPKFKSKSVPMNWDKDTFLVQEIRLFGESVKLSAVFMTTPHAVVFLDDFEEYELEKLGSAIETHQLFPEKINVNFAIIENRNLIRQKTWERGVGMTLACGTGASASVAIANRLSLVDKEVKVLMDGGSLVIKVNEIGEIVMQGKVSEIANGKYFYEENNLA